MLISVMCVLNVYCPCKELVQISQCAVNSHPSTLQIQVCVDDCHLYFSSVYGKSLSRQRKSNRFMSWRKGISKTSLFDGTILHQ